jgi:hypothetical protein
MESFSCPCLLVLWVLLRTLICIMSFVATFVTSDKAEIFSIILFWTIYSIMSRLATVETNILNLILLLPPIDYITPFLTLFCISPYPGSSMNSVLAFYTHGTLLG